MIKDRYIKDSSPLCLLPLLDRSSLTAQNPGVKIPRHEPPHCRVTQGLDTAVGSVILFTLKLTFQRVLNLQKIIGKGQTAWTLALRI